ncbi:hypothetical protein ACHWQZ_G001688 [Mnemiopsis leidyi]
MKDGQTGSYAGTPASMTLMEKDKDKEHSPPSSTYSTKEKGVPGKVSPQSCVSQKVSKNVSNNVPKSTKSPKNSLKAVPKFTNGHNGAPECGRCHSDQFVREGLSCYLCNEMFHACCREPGAGSTSSTAICPKSWYTAVATLTRKENSDTHNGRWGHFMFMCNKCQNKVSDLKRKENCSDKITKMVNVACESGVTFGEKATNTDGLSELTNFPLSFGNSESLNESPDNTCSSEKSLEKILESFKDQVLESVENLMSQKLDSHNNFRSRTPRPSSDSSTPSYSSYSASSKTYLGAFQSTPVPSQPRNCLPSASVSSIDLAVKSIRNDVEKSSISQDHVVVLRSNDDSVNVIDEKKRVTDALKAVPISDLRENKKSNKIVLHFPSEQAKVNAKTTLEKTLEGCKISVDEGKKIKGGKLFERQTKQNKNDYYTFDCNFLLSNNFYLVAIIHPSYQNATSMADKGGAPVSDEKRTSTIQIKVVQAKNLRGVKGDSVTAYARVEFGKTLGETNKAEIGPDGITKFNFNASIEVNLDDPSAIDEICHRLVVFNVIEVLPKEKKAREEKTAPIGQGVLDLSSLLKGENGFSQWVVIHSGTTAETVAANTGQNILQPELQVEVSVTNPLVSADVYAVSNHMTIRVDSVYSLPDTWQPSNNATHNYNAVMTVPLSDTVDVSVNAGAGAIRPAPEKNMDLSSPQKVVPRRYASSNGLTGAVVQIPNSSVESYVYEEEDGDIRSKEHHNFRKEAEKDKARVTWNSERNVFLLPSATDTLQERIAKCRAWPMEIFRSSLSSGAKKGKDDDTATSCHGIAWINLAPLLYPGVTRIKGAALVHPYIESEVLERAFWQTKKTTRSGTVSGEDSGQQRVSSGGSRRGVSSAKKGAKLLQDSKKAAKEPAEGGEGEQKNQEAQIYTEARSYIVVEIVLEKPLVSKRPPEELAAKVAEYIPKRSSMTKHHCGADEAVSEYHKQIGDVANLVLNEYRQKFGVSNESPDSDDLSDERKRALIYDLNSSGKYFAFKERLKQSVVKVVREKFFKTSAFQKEEELHQFLSELYVFLIEQMHKGVSNVFSLQNNAAPLPSPLDEESLIHFAKEAELNQNFELAARYYQERLAMDQNNSASWFDYGCFSLLVGNVSKAGECFRECLGLDQHHILALLMYGVVCVMEERYDVAETFFEDSTCVQPDNYLAWTILGLFYDSRDNDIGAEMAFLEANKHFHKEESSIFLSSAAALLDLHAYSLVESALSHELLSSPKTLNQEYYILLAKLHMAKGELAEAESYVKQATVLNHTNPAGWALLGHILYLGGESKGARDNYERTLSYEAPTPDTHSIRLRLASIYLQLQQYSAAKNMFLLACRDSASCITWLGVGISCYRLGELSEAEQALSEANILNNTDPEVWGYLSLVCLKTSRKLEAEQSYKYALRVGLKDADLLGEIKSTQKEVGFGDAGF